MWNHLPICVDLPKQHIRWPLSDTGNLWSAGVWYVKLNKSEFTSVIQCMKARFKILIHFFWLIEVSTYTYQPINLYLYSALIVIEQWGFFSVPLLLYIAFDEVVIIIYLRCMYDDLRAQRRASSENSFLFCEPRRKCVTHLRFKKYLGVLVNWIILLRSMFNRFFMYRLSESSNQTGWTSVGIYKIQKNLIKPYFLDKISINDFINRCISLFVNMFNCLVDVNVKMGAWYPALDFFLYTRYKVVSFCVSTVYTWSVIFACKC